MQREITFSVIFVKTALCSKIYESETNKHVNSFDSHIFFKVLYILCYYIGYVFHFPILQYKDQKKDEYLCLFCEQQFPFLSFFLSFIFKMHDMATKDVATKPHLF